MIAKKRFISSYPFFCIVAIISNTAGFCKTLESLERFLQGAPQGVVEHIVPGGGQVRCGAALAVDRIGAEEDGDQIAVFSDLPKQCVEVTLVGQSI